ncbi:MAG: ABC transporter permease [Oscillospiraceae bacterium]|nr:ABC transporter permease [Oscillospiraceae bacterium]
MENIRLAFQGIWGHKMRSFLTMLGIIIGIASIITIVSTIKGTNEQIKQNLIGSGSNVVTVQLYQDSYTYDLSYNPPPEGVKVIEESTREVLEGLDGVEQVSFFTKREWSENVSAGSNSFSGGVFGVDRVYLELMDYQITYGRTFGDADFENCRKVVILDKTAAATLFPGVYPVGKTIEIKSEAFTVVGVVDKGASFAPTINSMEDYYMYADTSGGSIFMPGPTWPVVYRFDEPQAVVVRANSTDDMTRAGKSVADYLTANQISSNGSKVAAEDGEETEEAEVSGGSSFSYRSEDLLEQAQQLQEMSNSTNQQLIWIASISLLVGGIGVMNIMLVSVTERTSEIGLKKALGARKHRIRIQFLTEAAVLTSLGGIVGVVLGILLAELISRTNGIPVAISATAILISVIFSTVIGVVFGLLPAVKAANLNPIEALRRD